MSKGSGWRQVVRVLDQGFTKTVSGPRFWVQKISVGNRSSSWVVVAVLWYGGGTEPASRSTVTSAIWICALSILSFAFLGSFPCSRWLEG